MFVGTGGSRLRFRASSLGPSSRALGRPGNGGTADRGQPSRRSQSRPLSGFVIGLSVITFYFAERDNRPGLYFAAGMIAGWVYWIKQVVVLYGIVFIFLAVTNRRLRWNWI
jgi:hypothetical protein